MDTNTGLGKGIISTQDLPDGTVIKKGSVGYQEGIPVYLPNRTLAGTATIDEREDGVYMEFKMPPLVGDEVAGRMMENLVGISFISLEREALDEAMKKQKEG